MLDGWDVSCRASKSRPLAHQIRRRHTHIVRMLKPDSNWAAVPVAVMPIERPRVIDNTIRIHHSVTQSIGCPCRATVCRHALRDADVACHVLSCRHGYSLKRPARRGSAPNGADGPTLIGPAALPVRKASTGHGYPLAMDTQRLALEHGARSYHTHAKAGATLACSSSQTSQPMSPVMGYEVRGQGRLAKAPPGRSGGAFMVSAAAAR